MRQQPDVIGSVVRVTFPKLRLANVPAKVDTGADSSAIWASGVHEKDGKLQFILFGKGSKYYSGKVLATKDFSVSLVKNSFGQAQRRYKVGLAVRFGNRTIKARFTLADRSAQKYPVLIGRRTLHGKFLVDVAHKPPRRRKQNKDLLVLDTKNRRSVGKFFSDSRQSDGISVTLAQLDDLYFSIDNGRISVAIGKDGTDIADFGLVYFKSIAGKSDIAAAAAQYLLERGVCVVDEAVGKLISPGKLFQYMVLAGNSIAVPPTIFISLAYLDNEYEYVSANLGLPFILKDTVGAKGKNNFLIKNRSDFKAVCAQARSVNIELLAQKFIPNDGDFRLLVMGGRVRLAIWRVAGSKQSHLNNTSAGGTAELVPLEKLPQHILSASTRVASLLRRDIAGVDMLQDKSNGSWYCLEANESPQLASGAFVSEKRLAFAEFLKEPRK